MDLQKENKRRLDNLCRQSHKWLIGAGFKIAKNLDTANELVCELYLYLAERINPAIWYGDDTFNLLYCQAFLRTRNINRIKANNRFSTINESLEIVDTPYDEEFDERLESTYKELRDELDRLEKTPKWASARIYQLYQFNDEMTLDKLAKEIGLSKSTVFLNTKRVKKHLKEVLDNPFRPVKD